MGELEERMNKCECECASAKRANRRWGQFIFLFGILNFSSFFSSSFNAHCGPIRCDTNHWHLRAQMKHTAQMLMTKRTSIASMRFSLFFFFLVSCEWAFRSIDDCVCGCGYVVCIQIKLLHLWIKLSNAIRNSKWYFSVSWMADPIVIGRLLPKLKKQLLVKCRLNFGPNEIC